MPFSAYGAPQFGLADVRIATWNATDDYSAEVDVMSAQALNTVMRVVSAELTGDDQITATASRAVGAQITMRMGGVSLEALEVMTGSSPASSLTTPNEVKNLRILGGQRMPYFGVVGKALAEEGQGSFEIFIPKCKIMGDVNLVQMAYGEFAIPEMTVMAVGDESYGIVNMIPVETDRALTIPPANVAAEA